MKLFILLFLLFACERKAPVSGSRSVASLTAFPGNARAYIMGDSLVEVSASGIRKYGFTEAVQDDDKFHLGSCTKAMTATLVALMIEEGYLSWSTRLDEIFPDFEIHPSYRSLPLERLLVHHSGFPVRSPVLTHQASRETVSRNILKNAPVSTGYSYSNFNYIVAGHALERLSGRSWEELMREKIFSPLSMVSCGFGVTSSPDEIYPSEPWAHEGQKPLQVDNPAAMGPAGTVHCNLQDWGKFLSMQLKGVRGESDFLNQETFTKLFTPDQTGASSYTYGGWIKEKRSWAGGAVFMHAGSNTLNYAVAWIAPLKNSVFASTANTGGEEGFQVTDDAVGDMIRHYLSF